MKKTIIIVYLILLTVAVTAACGSGKTEVIPDNMSSTSDNTLVDISDYTLSTYAEKDLNTNADLKISAIYDSSMITVAIANSSDSDLTYGTFYQIEYYYQDKWCTLPFKDGIGFDDIGYPVAAGKSAQWSTNLMELKNPLQFKGLYRIIKNASLYNGETSSMLNLSAEFKY